MDLAAFLPIFIFLCGQETAMGLEPPTNVTFRCHNMQNTLKWSYGKTSPGQRFKISIRAMEAYNGDPELWVDPPALEADLSFLSNPSNTYLLTVTAVNGQNKSDAVPEDGIIFSYFRDSPYSNQKCFVDFPHVNVTAIEEGSILYSFKHPWLVYLQNLPRPSVRRLRRKKKSHDEEPDDELPVFYYMVDIKNQRRHGQQHCMDSVCEETLTVDPAQKSHCLKFHGELKKISIHSTEEYCVESKEKTSYLIHYCVAGSLLVLSALALVLYMVYRKKTSPSTSLPSSMTFTSRVKQWASRDTPERVYVPVVAPASPTSVPDESEVITTVTPAEDDFRLPLRMPVQDVGVSDEVPVVNNAESEYMAGRSLEEGEELNSEEASSGYEKRQVFVELAPGEEAEGYRG